jgi:acyl transferase domain-containing protein/NADPH:quinone reductase-like Zn-dependent oxidoreductase
MNSIDIAIVGAACRLPGAPSLHHLAELLLFGRDAVTEIPDSRWSKDYYYDSDRQQLGKSYTFAAGCLDSIGAFDAGFFGMSPREAMNTDPQQRLLLELTYEAFEDAGWPPSTLAGRDVAVYVGASGWDYATVKVGDIALMDSHSMQGLSLSSLANRISYAFNLAGPSLTVDTACSSSLVAISLGCDAIRRGDAAVAVVGSANLLISPQNFVGFSRASMLSPTGRCHPFDARADGYVRAEGGGVVLLKPLRDAIADGDDIRAVIHGVGVNSDGRTPAGFSVPGQQAQTELLRRTYEAAGVDPNSLCYLEAHGTGTPVGDPIEAAALGAALGRRRRRPLPIGSIKSNIGHLEAASGMAGLMKLLTILDRQEIPASLHCETPNPNIPFTELNLSIASRPAPLEPGSSGVVLGINSFGFGGTNAHLIVGEAPTAPPRRTSDTAPPPLIVSAKSEAALQALAQTWANRLRCETKAGAAVLARSAGRHRDHFAHRLVVPAGDPVAMAEALEAWASREETAVVSGRALGAGLVLVFSGNGSQWAGMGADAFAHNSIFRDAIGELDAIFAPLAGWSLAARLRDPPSEAELQRTEIAQPLLFAVQVGATQALRGCGVRPRAVLGHSVGEVAAAWACGALSLRDAVEVIFHRSRLQQGLHGRGGMAVLSLGPEEARSFLETAAPDLEIAAVNGPRAVSVAGSSEDLQRLDRAARAARRAVVRLPLAYAFHSRTMAPLEKPLRSWLAGLVAGAPSIPMRSTTTGERVGAGDLDADYWWRNVRDPVLFAPAVGSLVDEGYRIFLEVGPKPTLRAHLDAILKQRDVAGAALMSLNAAPADGDPFPAIAARCHVAGADIAAAEVLAGPTDPRRLPVYPWQRQEHWLGATTEAVELVSPANDHPLLGFRRDEAKTRWTSLLSANRFPWIADHQVDGAPVLPAAALIDVALAAAQTRQGEASAVEVSDFEVLRPLLVEGVREVVFEMVSPDRFEISSRPRLSNEDRVVVARGAFAPAPVLPAHFERAPAPAIGRLDATQFYERITGLGIDYGPEFRAVGAASIFGPDETEIVFPDGQTPMEPGWRVDPRRLDAALQALFATRSLDHTQPGDSIVPWRFGRIRFLRPQSQPVAAACRLKRIGPKAHCADFALLDADGAVVLELSDCWFVRIRPGQPAKAERYFWLANAPCAEQPAPPASLGSPTLGSPTLGSPTLGSPDRQAERPASEILGHAYATATAYETVRRLAEDNELAPAALVGDGRVAAEGGGLNALLDWLERDGLATRRGGAWKLEPASALPGASEIWQTLFFDEPQAFAEVSLAAISAANLPDTLRAGAPRAASDLRAQVFETSPTAAAASAAVVGAVRDVLAGWPRERPLRLAVAGRPTAQLLRDLLEATTGRPRHVVLFGAERFSGALAAELRQHPGLVLERSAFGSGREARFDLLVAVHGVSEGVLSPAAAAAALGANGACLLVEPQPSRFWTLANGLVAPAAPAALADQLVRAGLQDVAWTEAAGAVWPAAIIVGRAAAQGAMRRLAAPMTLATGGACALADRLTGPPGVHRIELDALADARLETGALVVAVASDGCGGAELAAFCGALAKAVGALAAANARLVLLIEAPENDPGAAALAGLRRVMVNEGLDAGFVHVAPGVTTARILEELRSTDERRDVALTEQGRIAPRLRLGLPKAPVPRGACRLEINRPGLLASLNWESLAPREPGEGEVAIDVRACGLNFRDVMWALGALPDEALMDGFSGPTLGLECAGVVTKVGPGVSRLRPGDHVAALAPAALATNVVTSASAVLAIPPDMAFAAAATLPVTAMTVIYALGRLAQLAPGERVLIHGGAGGVGLAAIQYAHARGAEIHATAGSEERRAILRALGVRHVYDSRSSTFADAILRTTGGEGVDVVLNSLSGELMQQSMKLLRPFGRFVEIGKRDLFANSQVGLRPLRHNASYFAVDADQLPLLRPSLAAEVLEEATRLIASGALRPSPYRCFEAADVVEAFRLMQSGGHVGKIVIRPDDGLAGDADPCARPVFRKDRTYVVTGGASGFGLETARWLADHGAGGLALLSRRGPAAAGIEAALDALASQGVDAKAYACDVSDEADLAAALVEVRQDQGPIGGVFHAAMVMDDGLLKDLDAERFAASLAPKLDGAAALDRLTRRDPIEIFVLFSSISAAIGNPGQANYVVANAAMEAIARARAAAGLPALAVQWGPICDTGVLARDARVRDLLERVMAGGELTAREALDALPVMLASGLPVAGYAAADWGLIRRQLPIGETALLSEASDEHAIHGHDASITEQVLKLGADEARALVETFLVGEVSSILRLDSTQVDVEQPISNMGFDSLMTLELHLAVESRLKCEVPVTSVGGGSTLRAIAARIVRSLHGEPSPADEDGDLQDHLVRHELFEAEPLAKRHAAE